MRYSIIIPAYNAERYLVNCINSVLSQTYKDFEVIIVNDGSTDYTPKICEQLQKKDKRIKIVDKKNEGVSMARNAGLKIASGEYITFVDADDWICENYLETIDKAIGDVDLLFFGNIQNKADGTSQVFSPGNRYANEKKGIETILYKMISNDCWYEFFGYTWNKCYRASIIRENKIFFEPGLSLREDELFTNSFCRYITSVKTIGDAIYNYRFSYDGLTYKFHPGSEVLLLANGLARVMGNIDYLPLKRNRMQKVFHYTFVATTNMHTKESLPIFEYLFDFYRKNREYMCLENKRYRKIFDKPRWIARLLFLRKRKKLKKDYNAV